MSLFGNMFFVDVIIVRMKRRNHAGLGLGQNPMTVSFLIRNRKDTETQGRNDMKIKAKIRVIRS